MTTNNSDLLVMTTTHDDEAKARTLAADVVRARLAACAQVYRIQSVYWWEGEVQDAAEWRIDFKTRTELAAALTDFVNERHDYDTPEVIAVPVVAGSPAYLDWVRAETAGR
ncbi:divalent-cation tolerance protein CutA [Kitasatospora purpeofusca]|uniref:divalent-cation tolerance protein CutA n=1 Tax=Kitasatospora purpeofusca TaxID=67352 RepID=UPI0036D3994B